MTTHARSSAGHYGAALSLFLLASFCASCRQQLNLELRQRLQGQGPVLLRVEIEGQQKRAIISDAASLRYLETALSGARLKGPNGPRSGTGGDVYEAALYFRDAECSRCRITPYLELRGMELAVLWDTSDADQTYYDVPFRGEMPVELRRVLYGLAPSEVVAPRVYVAPPPDTEKSVRDE